jgi:ADP-heptose:LPS heptosyltransferase
MHGSGSFVNPLIALLAEHTAGFYTPGDYRPDSRTYMPYPDEGLEIRRLLRLVEFLGIPVQGEELEFPVTGKDREALLDIEEALDLRSGEYICVHAGASVAPRRWPPEYFAAVADALADQGLQIVLTGTALEAKIVHRVRHAMKCPAINLAGQTNLGAAGALVQGARLVVCNDTGISHLAAAVKTPSVVLSTGNNPERWAPIDAQRHRVLCPSSDVAPRDVLVVCRKLLLTIGRSRHASLCACRVPNEIAATYV